jgi:hypothetical protein
MAYNNATDVCKLAATWLGCDPAALSDVASVSSSSSKEDTVFNQVYDTCRKTVLEVRNWPFANRDIELNLAAGTSKANWSAATISGITQADPAVITTANNHNFLDDWSIRLSDVSGMTEINGQVVRSANGNATTFEAYQLDTRKFSAYTSGGNAIRYEVISDYQNGYTYEVPDDHLKIISTLPVRAQFEIRGSGNSKRLLSPESSLSLEYTADISEVTEMSNRFIRCWAARIAAESAISLQKKGAVKSDMWQHYAQVLLECGVSAGQDQDAKSLIRETSPTLDAGGWSY